MKMTFKSVMLSIPMLLVIGVSAIQACEPEIPKHPFRKAKVVFYGELVEAKESNDKCMSVAKFKIEKFWKGKLTGYVTLETPTTLCCGYNFRTGEKYLVYAYLTKSSQLETSVGWVMTADFADERIKKLGKAKLLK